MTSLPLLMACMVVRAGFNTAAAESQQHDNFNLGQARKTIVSDQQCTILKGGVVDCTGRHLGVVPSLPLTSTSIRLDINKIANISNTPFLGMDRLTLLNLSCNPLRYLSPSSFDGLTSLKHLFLQKTKLFIQRDIDFANIFKDAKHLIEFHWTYIQYYKVNAVCRSEQEFTNVELLFRIPVLELDITVIKFLSHRENVTNNSAVIELSIWSMHLCGWSATFQKRTLFNFHSLKRLYINTDRGFCLKFETDALSEIHDLRELVIRSPSDSRSSGAVFTDCKANDFIRNVTKAASKTNAIQILKLEQLSGKFSKRFDCRHAWDSFSLLNLKILSLNQDTLHPFECTGVKPMSIHHLEVRQNCFTSFFPTLMIDLAVNIETIDGLFQSICSRDTKVAFRHQAAQSTHVYTRTSKGIQRPSSTLRELRFSHSYGPPYLLIDPIYYFPNLTHMEYSWISSRVKDYHTIRKDFSTRRPMLRYLDLTGCKIDHIESDAFVNARMLRTLKLASNGLRNMGSNLSHELKHISSLHNIDISDNDIADLDKDVFKNMKQLVDIDVSSNALTQFVPTLNHLKFLRRLNISNNYIKRLSHALQTDLDTIARHKFRYLDISNNPLDCNCDSLSFLKWITDTTIVIINKKRTSCILSNGKEIKMKSFLKVIGSLNSNCSSTSRSTLVIAIACAGSAVLVLTVIVTGLAYKFRWKFRYLYYMTKFRYRKILNDYDKIYDYDAFISYSSEDYDIARTQCIEYLETLKGLKLCIHERDFLPGHKIAYNISIGIHSSRRTILFVSQSFLESEWCLYELNIAQMEALHTKRTVVLIVLLDSTVKNQLPIDILDVIRTTTYIEYPEHGDQDDIQVFWNRLINFIQEP